MNDSVIKQITEERYTQPIAVTDYNISRLAIIRRWLPESGNLLEIGAWDGTTIRYYKEKFKGRTAGVDISHAVLERAAPFFDEVKACDLNNDDIPYPEQTFDVVICGEVIEHVYDTDRLLQNIHRVLKDDGILVVSTPNLASFWNRIFIVLGFQPLYTEVSSRSCAYGNPLRRKKLVPAGHIRNFTYGAFCDIVHANNFDIVKASSATVSKGSGIRFIEFCAAKVHVSLGSDIVLLCRKKAAQAL